MDLNINRLAVAGSSGSATAAITLGMPDVTIAILVVAFVSAIVGCIFSDETSVKKMVGIVIIGTITGSLAPSILINFVAIENAHENIKLLIAFVAAMFGHQAAFQLKDVVFKAFKARILGAKND